MTPRTGWSVSVTLGAVAFSAIGLAALFATADPEGVVSVAVVGHLLWLVVLLRDVRTRERPKRPRAFLLTACVLGTAALGEGLGMVMALGQGANEQALWFGLGLSFAVGGIALTARSTASDGAFAAQLFFHGLLLFPTLGALLVLVLSLWGGTAASEARARQVDVTRQLLTIGGVVIPCLFTALGANVMASLAQPADERDLPWTAFLAHQAIFTVILYRWAVDGLLNAN